MNSDAPYESTVRTSLISLHGKEKVKKKLDYFFIK